MIKKTKIKLSETTGVAEKEVTTYYLLFVPVYRYIKEITTDL